MRNKLSMNTIRGLFAALIKPALRIFQIAFTCLLVSACDGGIFGTGGPEDESILIATDSSDIGADSSPGLEAVPDSPSVPNSPVDENAITNAGNEQNIPESAIDPAMSPGIADVSDPASTADSISGMDSNFINDNATTGNAAPALRLINTSSQTIMAGERLDQSNSEFDLLDMSVVDAGNTSELVFLNADINALSVIGSSPPIEIGRIQPFTAVSGSITNVLIREESGSVSLIPMSVEVNTTDPTLSMLRVVQGSGFNSATRTASLMLESAGINPGGIDAEFSPISYNDPVSFYIEVPAGDYSLRDPLNRFSEQDVSLAAGAVTTFVFADEPDNFLIPVEDSQ